MCSQATESSESERSEPEEEECRGYGKYEEPADIHESRAVPKVVGPSVDAGVRIEDVVAKACDEPTWEDESECQPAEDSVARSDNDRSDMSPAARQGIEPDDESHPTDQDEPPGNYRDAQVDAWHPKPSGIGWCALMTGHCIMSAAGAGQNPLSLASAR
jgi:hypothetical protein